MPKFSIVKKPLDILVRYVSDEITDKHSHSRKARKEHLSSLVSVEPTEDHIVIQVEITANSSATFKDKRGTRPAIPAKEILELETRVPSLIAVDVDVMALFTENLITCICIEHNKSTGLNILCIA